MLIILFAIAMESIAPSLGLSGSRTYLIAMANLFAFLALLTKPLVLVPSLLGPPLVARARNRGFWRCLLAALAVGPLAFIVAFLRPRTMVVSATADRSLSCPQCTSPYSVEDYRPDADSWSCSKCGGPLPRSVHAG
jgi:hypothetical protein